MSDTFTVHPILGCLREVENFIGNYDWDSINDAQKRFLETFMKAMQDLEKFDEGEIKSTASKSIPEVNKWLAENGFPDLQLQPISDPSAFAVASILHVFLKWKEEGTKTTIEHGGKEYPAAKIKYDGMGIFNIPKDDRTFVNIPTKRKGEEVYLVVHPEGLAKSHDWITKIHSMRKKHQVRYSNSYEGVVFPTIDYDDMVDISFLKGMKNKDFFIAEAIQQTRFKMNEIGAEVESAAAMSCMRCCASAPKPPLIINEPFLVAIFREELATPYFIGHFTPEDWKEVEIEFKD